MTTHRTWTSWAFATLCLSLGVDRPGAAQSVASATRATPPAVQARLAFSRALPQMDGAHLQTKIVEVSYAPGGSSPSHRHPCAVVGYVIEGALRSKVNAGPDSVYKAGETFYEAPNDHHAVSANASKTEPVRFIAYFVCDHDAPLVTPTP